MQVHICLLRTLAWHDSTKLRAKRKLDFANLDHTSWKDFLWEFLRYAQQTDWWRSHVIHRAPEKPLVDLHTGAVKPGASLSALKADSAEAKAIMTNGMKPEPGADKPPAEGGVRAASPAGAPARSGCSACTTCTARTTTRSASACASTLSWTPWNARSC